MKKDGVMDADTEDMPLTKDMTGGRKGSAMPMYGPTKMYGNKK